MNEIYSDRCGVTPLQHGPMPPRRRGCRALDDRSLTHFVLSRPSLRPSAPTAFGVPPAHRTRGLPSTLLLLTDPLPVSPPATFMLAVVPSDARLPTPPAAIPARHARLACHEFLRSTGRRRRRITGCAACRINRLPRRSDAPVHCFGIAPSSVSEFILDKQPRPRSCLVFILSPTLPRERGSIAAVWILPIPISKSLSLGGACLCSCLDRPAVERPTWLCVYVYIPLAALSKNNRGSAIGVVENTTKPITALFQHSHWQHSRLRLRPTGIGLCDICQPVHGHETLREEGETKKKKKKKKPHHFVHRDGYLCKRIATP